MSIYAPQEAHAPQEPSSHPPVVLDLQWLHSGRDFTDPADKEIQLGFNCSCQTYCDAILDEEDDL